VSWWQSRPARKFRRSRMAVASTVVIAFYLVVAALVFVGAIDKSDTVDRVGPKNVPGFGLTQKPSKRWENAEFLVGRVRRALGRDDPRRALDELRFGRERVADLPVEELRAKVDEADAIMDRLAQAEEVDEQPETWSDVDQLTGITASMFTVPGGWDGLVHSFLLSCGTDRQGRSIAARGFYAINVSIKIGLVVALVAVLAGGLLGAAAAYYGGAVDHFVIWLYSTLSAIPGLVLLGVLVFMFAGNPLENTLVPVYVALGLTFWIGPCRVIRGEALRVKELDYVQAANAIGQSRFKILLKHILPNVSHLMFINFSLLFIAAIKTEVILTFLGLGVKDEPSWGTMISQSAPEVVNAFFWQIGTATALMFGLVLAFNIFTDALQDALDPKHIA